MFNMINYLKDHNIQYKTEGKNCSVNFINICCPFCQETNFHLGLHESKGFGNCWKCNYHSLYEIIQKLTPYKSYKEIISLYQTDYIVQNKIEKKINNTKILLPGSKLLNVHKNYLKNRGFNPDYLEEKYKLQGTTIIGKYQYSLIIPIIQNNQILTYQTRGIRENEKYINCNPDKEIIPIKDCIFNLDNCKKSYIIVTEGAMKVFRLGDNSCATFGKNVTNKQIEKLLNYEKIFIYFDNDLAGQEGAKKLSSILDSLGKEVYIINNNIAPDNLNQEQVKEFWNYIYKEI